MTKELLTINEDDINELVNFDDDDLMLGVEDFSSEDLMKPNIRILEMLSPEIDKASPKYLEHAEPGLFHNTANNDLLAEFTCSVCFKENIWVEWDGRNFVKNYNYKDGAILASEATMDDQYNLILKNRNTIVNTINYTIYDFYQIIRNKMYS